MSTVPEVFSSSQRSTEQGGAWIAFSNPAVQAYSSASDDRWDSYTSATVSSSAPRHLGIKLPSAQEVHKYSMRSEDTSSAAARSPRNFKLQGGVLSGAATGNKILSVNWSGGSSSVSFCIGAGGNYYCNSCSYVYRDPQSYQICIRGYAHSDDGYGYGYGYGSSGDFYHYFNVTAVWNTSKNAIEITFRAADIARLETLMPLVIACNRYVTVNSINELIDEVSPVSWTDLEPLRTGITWGQKETKEFNLPSPATYQYFRLLIESIGTSGNTPSVGRLTLLGKSTARVIYSDPAHASKENLYYFIGKKTS